MMKNFFLCVATLLLLAACMSDDDSYQAGFPTLATKYNLHYANNTSDELYVYSYGSWYITRRSSGGEWCTMDKSSGVGYTGYTIALTYTENTTGQQRYAGFQIADRDHADDAYVNWSITQLATRGDGSLGNAAMVKGITGSDGSQIHVSYDPLRRPLSLQMTKDNTVLHELAFAYDDSEGVMTVTDNAAQLTASYTNDYQPYRQLVSSTDTVRFAEQSHFNYYSSSYAFNIEHSKPTGYMHYSFLVPSVNDLAPDELHNADSIRFQRGSIFGDVETIKMKPSYSSLDNRCQSLDVNQLLLGVERCNPYLLLSLFRAARSTSIFRTVESDKGNYEVDIVLNSDKSVRTMTVTHGGDGGEKVVYDFEY